MSRMDEIKSETIIKYPERKKTFDQESKRLKTAAMIVELRDSHGLSQQALAADLAGVPKSTIVRIENAQVNTSVETLNRIAQAVNKELR